MSDNVQDINSDKELVNTEIQTLESMHSLLKEDTQNVKDARIETPTEVVEKKLSDFVTDAFKATDRDFAFNEQLKTELSRRMPNMTDNQFIALFSTYNVNLNDRVSKIIAPTFGMMQTKQQAEIAAQKQAAQNQIVINPSQSNVGNSISSSIEGKPDEVKDIMIGGNVLSQLFTAIGQSQRNEIKDTSQVDVQGQQ